MLSVFSSSKENCRFLVVSTAACGGKKENTEPELTGVSDKTIEAGQEFNALEGISASDAEDGDLLHSAATTVSYLELYLSYAS